VEEAGFAVAKYRIRRWAVLVVAVVMLSTVTGCASGPGSASQGAAVLARHAAHQGTDLMAARGAATAGKLLLQQMRGTATQAKTAHRLPLIAGKSSGVKQTTTQIQRQLGQVPKNPPPEMARVAAQLRQLRTRLDELNNIQWAADREVSRLPAGAQKISLDATVNARFYLTPAQVTKLRQTLAGKAQEQALELGCDALWAGLTPPDKATASDAYSKGLVVATHTDRLKAATVEAVADEAYQLALRTLGPSVQRAVDWTTYAWGVLGKARELQQNDWQALSQITASGHTTALVHYARLCLRPPR
jgi:hypothetical protein